MATQSASGTIGQIERQTLQLEFSAVREEFDRISTTTEFNGKTLIDGSLTAAIQGSEQITIKLDLYGSNESRINLNQELDLTAISSTGLGLANLSITTAEEALIATKQIEISFNTLTRSRGKIGALQNPLQITLGNLGVSIENLSAADSTIRNANLCWRKSPIDP